MFEVVLTEDAEHDLEAIFTYTAKHDSRSNAERVLIRLLEVAETLTASPSRGSAPKELKELGDREYTQVFLKPYRVIYRAIGRHVVIYLIADGRRDMQSLLARRLLGG